MAGSTIKLSAQSREYPSSRLLLEGAIAAKFLAAVLAQPGVKRLLLSEHFSVDGTLIEAWASLKSFRRRDGGDEGGGAGRDIGRNAERNFRGERRTNDTHQSTTDPEARLYKKGDGPPARVCYLGHALMENRHGLAVAREPSDGNGGARGGAAAGGGAPSSPADHAGRRQGL